MKKNARSLSLASSGLKYKLKISFYLMSILPLLISAYLVSNYILPATGLKIDITVSMAVSIFIAVIGFFLIKEVFDRILSVTNEAKLIAAGNVNRKLNLPRTDEVGDLGDALNQLTQRIRNNMDELKNYSEKTTEINLGIQKRVIVLSSLLQISSLVSQGAKLDDILHLAVEKSRLLASSDVAYLLFREENHETFTMKIIDGINSGYLLEVSVDPGDELFKKITQANRPIILDKQNLLAAKLSEFFYEKLRFKNTIALPVYLRGRVTAILGIGNSRDNFTYNADDIELLDIFAKQVAIAVENDILMHRVEKLEIKDTLTGLYNQVFIRDRLQEEIKRAVAYQRPCAFIIFDIDDFKKYHQEFGSLQSESALKRIGTLIHDSVSEIDRVARFGDDEFAVVLPEKNKRQAKEIAEDIRRKIESGFSEEADSNKKITVTAGVSENPLDGIRAEELILAAKEFLEQAKKKGKNRTLGSK